jgi:glycosyltransferase involved in cell wall biosynthesis
VDVRPEVQRIGIVGRLAPWKGQDVFLRAFAQAFGESPPRAVVIGSAIFGEEDYASELSELAHLLGIRDRVDFVGFRRDVQAEFETLDLLVHASVLTEPFGTVVFEGMAAGLPVIAARSGGVAEYIEHARHGLLHTPGDAADLAAMLRLAADDRELRARLASEGRELTRQFASERVLSQWLTLYGTILGRPTDVKPSALSATR